MSRAVVVTAAFATLAALALAVPAFPGEVALTAPRTEGPAGGESVLSLRATADAETSALQGGLSYDAKVMDILEVTAGAALPEGARADFNADQPGWLRLGFVCSPSKAAFKGAGEVLRIKVRVKGAVGTESPLRLSKVRAWEPNDTEHRTTTTEGALKVVEASALPWIPIVVVVAILLLLALITRRKRRAPARGPAAPRSPGAQGRFCTACGASVPETSTRFCGTCGAALA